MTSRTSIRGLLRGGDRRSIAQSNRARALIERDPALVDDLATLAGDDDWLVRLRALDLLEKLAHAHPAWIEPHKRIFVGPIADSDQWEIRLQVVRALPLFRWSGRDAKRVEAILVANLSWPQTFVRAWALDALATFAMRRQRLAPIVRRYTTEFARSPSKALRARARAVAARLDS